MKTKLIKTRLLFIALAATTLIFSSCSDGNGTADDKIYTNPTPSTTKPESSLNVGVMLQGFDWTSNKKSRGSSTDWYKIISNNADEIKNTFEYVWFPPVSDSGSENGYLPRELNNLGESSGFAFGTNGTQYGSKQNLISSIKAISPAKAIADIVINHRVGTKNWGTFSNPTWADDYYSICSNDEGFTTPGSDMYGSSKKGAEDTGESYGSARDLDHTNWDVQNGIVSWMNDVLKRAGFAGWRYDFVKGYGGKYVGYYNAQTNAAFSVGEYWPTNGFSASNPTAWKNEIEKWISSTGDSIKTNDDNWENLTEAKIAERDEPGTKSRAFDFVLKGILNTVFGNKGIGIANKNYNLLASPAALYKSAPAYAVTFIDNHDTGSTQALWYLDPNDVGTAYAFILTHPGYPCVAWQHYFSASESDDSRNSSQYFGDKTVPGTTLTYKQLIFKLISLRADAGITEISQVNVSSKTSASRYLAEVSGAKKTLLVCIGSDYSAKESEWKSEIQGTDFHIWSKSNTMQ